MPCSVRTPRYFFQLAEAIHKLIFLMDQTYCVPAIMDLFHVWGIMDKLYIIDIMAQTCCSANTKEVDAVSSGLLWTYSGLDNIGYKSLLFTYVFKEGGQDLIDIPSRVMEFRHKAAQKLLWTQQNCCWVLFV